MQKPTVRLRKAACYSFITPVALRMDLARTTCRDDQPRAEGREHFLSARFCLTVEHGTYTEYKLIKYTRRNGH